MKYKFYISGLDCANCANKIERFLNEENEIDKAVVNFNKATITVYTKKTNGVLELVSSVAKKVEPNVKVSETDSTIETSFKGNIIELILGIILAILGTLAFKGAISKILIILAYLILLYRVMFKAFKQILKGTINENLLLTISCIGAYLTDNIHEGLMVIILYDIGKLLELMAVNNSKKSIKSMMDIKAEYANKVSGDEIERVNPKDIQIDDVILIKPYEKIPLDGVVISGEGKLNTSSITGESKLLPVTANDRVLSGMINTDSLIKIKVTNTLEDSTVSKILSLLDEATDRKAKIETTVSKIARIYTPIILLLAIITVIILPLLFDYTFNEALYRALVFLVISCPCAIAISVPLSYFSGIGRASKEGILIKGSDYLDLLGNIKKIIFDKTGTLTTGKFSDYDLIILNKEYSEEKIIKYYVSLEKLSNHPIGSSITELFKHIETLEVINFKEIVGFGVTGKIGNKTIKIGSANYCKSEVVDDSIYLNIDSENIAKLFLKDGLKKTSSETIKRLKEMNIEVAMYTGDNREIASKIGKKLGIEKIKYEMLPQDKFESLKEEVMDEVKIAFVGDGVNDAPSLQLAPIGISLGGIGSDAAIEASDIVIMNDQIEKIPLSINISKYTRKIIKENLIFAITTKILVLGLNILGVASMYQAVFADTGVTLLTIINTTRILRKYFK